MNHEEVNATNPFIVNPFQPLMLDPGEYIADEVFRVFVHVTNAISFFVKEGLNNHHERIDLGVRKGEVYDALNKRRYELDDSLKVLEDKKDALKQLFVLKGVEAKYLSKF